MLVMVFLELLILEEVAVGPVATTQIVDLGDREVPE